MSNSKYRVVPTYIVAITFVSYSVAVSIMEYIPTVLFFVHIFKTTYVDL